MDNHFRASKPDASSVRNAPKKLYEDCVPLCFPAGAQEHTESMMEWAMNCKKKTSETFSFFKEIYKHKLEEDGYIVKENSLKNEANPFEGMEANPRFLSAKKNFEVHIAPADPNYL